MSKQPTKTEQPDKTTNDGTEPEGGSYIKDKSSSQQINKKSIYKLLVNLIDRYLVIFYSYPFYI
jgi:hypothetical protein